jgi:glutamate-1-semialdehyde 2,1-aminomutase
MPGYLERTPRSRRLHERLRRVMPGGDTRSITWFEPYPAVIERGGGYELHDVDGNVYIDLLNNYTALVHGHAHPRIVAAITAQAGLGTVYPAPHGAQLRVAEELTRRVASVEQVRFTNSGSEAVLQAVRAARAYTRRPLLVKALGGYHGSWDQVPLTPAEAEAVGTPPEIGALLRFVPYNDLAALEDLLRREGERVAAILLEPVMGEGVIAGDSDYLRGVHTLADSYGALLILDEVVTFRLASGGRQETAGVSPHLTTFGKIIGGGLPVGAVGGSEAVMSVFHPHGDRTLPHSGTFNGNALTMAAGLVSLELLSGAEIDRINGLGESLAAGMREALAAHAIDGGVMQCGSLLHLVFETDAEPRRFSDLNLASRMHDRVHLACMEEGLFIAPRGLVNTSTVMDEDVIDEVVARFGRALERVAAAPPYATASARPTFRVYGNL